jgi:hypothetical protein
MADREKDLSELYSRLGYRRLNRTWAKVEILFGLCATGLGLFLGDWALGQAGVGTSWSLAAGGLGLFILGSYLALAGHRSHLYQSQNALTAYLVDEIRNLKGKG